MLNQIIFNSIVTGVGYSLFALSLFLIYNPTRFFHFAHGAVFTWGAYFGYLGHMILHCPLWLTFLMAMVASALLGMGLDRGIYHPIRRLQTSTSILLLASLGLYIVLQNAVSLIFGDDVKNLQDVHVTAGISLLGARITQTQLWAFVATGIAFISVGALLRFTIFGKQYRAVVSNPDLATIHGIDTERIIASVFILGSALAGLSALLVSLDTYITPTMGLTALVTGVVAMIVGGSGNVTGPLLGGLLLGFAQNIGGWKLGSQWQDTIAFAILILFLVLKPKGISSVGTRRIA